MWTNFLKLKLFLFLKHWVKPSRFSFVRFRIKKFFWAEINFGPRLYVRYFQDNPNLGSGWVVVESGFGQFIVIKCSFIDLNWFYIILYSVIKSRIRFQLITFFTNQMFMTVKTGVEMYMYSRSVTRDTDQLVAEDVRIINADAKVECKLVRFLLWLDEDDKTVASQRLHILVNWSTKTMWYRFNFLQLY